MSHIPKKSSVWKNSARMLAFAWKTSPSLTLGYYLSGILGGLISPLAAIYYSKLIDSLIGASKIGIAQIPLTIMLFLGARYLIDLAYSFFKYLLNNTYFDYVLRYKLQNKINFDFYEKVSSFDMEHLENPEMRTLLTKTKDTISWRPINMLREINYILSSLSLLIGSLLVVASFGWWVPIFLVLSNIPQFYLQKRQGHIEWSLYGSGAPKVKKLWYFNDLLYEKLTVIEMRIFGTRNSLLQKYAQIQNELLALNTKPLVRYTMYRVVATFMQVLITAPLGFYFLRSVITKSISIGQFGLLLQSTDNFNGSVGYIGSVFTEISADSLYVDDFFAVMSLKNNLKENPNGILLAQNTPPKIEFRSVHFTYPGSKTEALSGVSFVIEPGQNIALVGENGAGKTTIVKLLCRFYDATKGEILINDINIKDLNLDSWYSQIGTLFQQTVHYEFTVNENITLGSHNDLDENLIRLATKMSTSDEFINKLPNKYDQQLGRNFEDGVDLSGGEWQKLAIARAFYRQAPVLILDEPTSAIDALGENEIFENLEKSYINKSLILISHRFSTVRNVSKIFVVEDGKITESGTHSELLGKDGKYAKMFTTQAKGFED